MDDKWNPPETAPKDRAFMITTAGPEIDICYWAAEAGEFRDYHFHQRIAQLWPYMIAWKEMPVPAVIGNTEAETRKANGWPDSPSS